MSPCFRWMQRAALAGPGASGGTDELGDRLAELLFALTEATEAAGVTEAAGP